MAIPTEPIGSVPRPLELIEGMTAFAGGRISRARLDALVEQAVRDTLRRFEATGSPVVTDGEQGKPSFATYPVSGARYLASDGVTIDFADGHRRQLPRLNEGPFRYVTYARSFLVACRKHTSLPVKQAVIAPSALSLLYPRDSIPGYSREAFLSDLIREAESDIRGCLAAGAQSVQLDFTEGRLAVKLDPSQRLLQDLVDLNNRVLQRFGGEDRRRLGVHTCPGGDQDSTHSADVDYGELLPRLFQLQVGNFYIQLASEADPGNVLAVIKRHVHADQRVFIGVIDPLDPRVEQPQRVKERILRAAEFLAPSQLGSTDDCGFSPFADDRSTARDTAFAKIASRVEGTRLAAEELGI